MKDLANETRGSHWSVNLLCYGLYQLGPALLASAFLYLPESGKRVSLATPQAFIYAITQVLREFFGILLLAFFLVGIQSLLYALIMLYLRRRGAELGLRIVVSGLLGTLAGLSLCMLSVDKMFLPIGLGTGIVLELIVTACASLLKSWLHRCLLAQPKLAPNDG